MNDETAVSKPEIQAQKRLESYNHVVAVAQLRAVQMVATEFRVKPEFFSDENGPKLSYEVVLGSLHFSDEDRVAMAFVTLRVDAKSGRKKSLACQAEYVVTYEQLVDCEEEAVMAFLTRVAPFACYPYFRSLFATLDWAATTGLPPLPVHKEPARARPAGQAEPGKANKRRSKSIAGK